MATLFKQLQIILYIILSKIKHQRLQETSVGLSNYLLYVLKKES